jgi:hypothetical protein
MLSIGGEGGTGKSALLAKAVERAQGSHLRPSSSTGLSARPPAHQMGAVCWKACVRKSRAGMG